MFKDMSSMTTATAATSSWPTPHAERDGPDTIALPTTLEAVSWEEWDRDSKIWEANGRIGNGLLTPSNAHQRVRPSVEQRIVWSP